MIQAVDDRFFAALADTLAARAEREGLLVVGIDGRTAAGKTTFTRRLAAALSRAGTAPAVVHMDLSFTRPPAARLPVYFLDPVCPRDPGGFHYDYDWTRLRDQVLVPLHHRRRAAYQRYDLRSRRLAPAGTIAPGGVVIVDGMSSCRHELAGYYHFKVFLRTTRRTALARALARDGGRYPGWHKVFCVPEDDHYLARHRPAARADLIVDGSASRAVFPQRAAADLQSPQSDPTACAPTTNAGRDRASFAPVLNDA